MRLSVRSLVGFLLLAVVGAACSPLVEPTATPLPQATFTPTHAPATATPLPPSPPGTPTLPPMPQPTAPVPSLVPATGRVPIRIAFAPGGTTAVVQGTLPAFGLDRYVLRALAGQTMAVILTTVPQAKGFVVIFGANGDVLVSDHAGASSWSGGLLTTQDYFLDVRTGETPASYTLQVAIPPLTPGPSPQLPPKRVNFQPGSITAVVQGSLATNGLDRFVLKALAGQTMVVNVSSSQANMLLSINGANGDVLKSSGAGSGSWSGVLPTTQDYIISISTPDGVAASYTLQVTIPPLTAPNPEPQPRRIQFQPGSTSATVQGSLAAFGLDRYVLRALAGQTMTVSLSTALPGKGFVVIFGANGDVLISDHAGASSWSGRLLTTQDYFIDARTGETPANYTLQVTIPPLTP